MFSTFDTPDDTLGFACSASAGLPVIYGSTHKNVNGKKITLFDGGFLYNPFIPTDIQYPLVYASFRNDINYQKHIPLLQGPVDVVNAKADYTIDVPVGKCFVTGNKKDINKLDESGYKETSNVLGLKLV